VCVCVCVLYVCARERARACTYAGVWVCVCVCVCVNFLIAMMHERAKPIKLGEGVVVVRGRGIRAVERGRGGATSAIF
jgi:hypothetical protein